MTREGTSLGSLHSTVAVLLIIGVLLGVGLTILSTLSTETRTATATTDDTLTILNGTYVALDQSTVTASSATFENASSGAAYPATYFTFNSADKYGASSVMLSPTGLGSTLNNTAVNVSYTYGAGTTAQSSMDTTITAIGGFPTWLTIIVIVIAAAIIITLVMRSFGGGNTRE